MDQSCVNFINTGVSVFPDMVTLLNTPGEVSLNKFKNNHIECSNTQSGMQYAELLWCERIAQQRSLFFSCDLGLLRIKHYVSAADVNFELHFSFILSVPKRKL